jgi:uncharacterized integral membrane protein
MRLLQAILLLLLLGALFLFALQNTQAVTVRFLGWSMTPPVPLLIIGSYVLGMLSGWTVVAFLGRTVRGVAERRRRRDGSA